jgi:F-type H+-transporting ATPase subunit gamma
LGQARKILKRAKAVRNIRTVTKTMEMVASARFKKAHDRAVAARPFTTTLAETVAELCARCGEEARQHPLLREREDVRHDVMMVMTSNNGLCGPYNSNVLAVAIERIEQLRRQGYRLDLRVVGKRGVQTLRYRKYPIDVAYTEFKQAPCYSVAAKMADEFIAAYSDNRIGGMEVAYTEYISAGKQDPAIAQLLPLTCAEPPKGAPGLPVPIYEFMPNAREILDKLLPAVVRLRLYQCFLDAAAAEQISRVRAMGAATENADEMLHELTVRYNRKRQQQITTELAEIMGGAAGVE